MHSRFPGKGSAGFDCAYVFGSLAVNAPRSLMNVSACHQEED